MLWIVVLIGLAACGSDEASPRVPFKLNPNAGSAGDAPVDPLPDAHPTADHFDKGLDHPVIDGVASPFIAVRALLRIDVNGDQARDGVAVVEDPVHGMALSVALKQGESFAPATKIAGFGLEAGCELTSAQLRALSSTKAVLSVDAKCGEPKVVAPRRELLFALDPSPFLLERIDLTLGSDATAAQLKLAFSTEDADADGHDDVVVLASLTQGPGATPIEQRVVLADRGPSLSFDAAGFEAALLVRAESAKGLLRKTPALASADASQIVSLVNALCRDSDRPLLRVHGKPGFACGPSAALARALATHAAAEAAQGHLAAALDAYIALSLLGPKLTKVPLADATRALHNLKPRTDVTLTPGPNVSDASDPLRVPNVRFVSDALLFVAREPPVFFDLEHATEAPAPAASARITDPTGTLFLSAIERRCAGLFLRIERTSSVAEHSGLTQAVSTPALLLRDAFADCTDSPQTRHRDTAGFRVLGWAPQGVVAARGSEVRLVPLAMDGSAAGAPRVLDALTPRPAPLPSGRATVDASRYVWLTPFGVVVFGPASSPLELWRPNGWLDIGPSARDASISPSGRRIAVLSGGRVFLLSAGEKAAGSP